MVHENSEHCTPMIHVGDVKVCLHYESKKNKTPNSCPQLHQILTDFQNSFTVRLRRKFVMKSYLNTPPHPKRVATLLCEMSIFKKSHFLRNK